MEATTLTRSENTETTEVLTYEEFRFKQAESDPTKRQPFNNFYFYFLDEDTAGMFYTIYRDKPWFKAFSQEHAELIETLTSKMTTSYNKPSENPDKLLTMLASEEENLYKAYLVARNFATDKMLFE